MDIIEIDDIIFKIIDYLDDKSKLRLRQTNKYFRNIRYKLINEYTYSKNRRLMKYYDFINMKIDQKNVVYPYNIKRVKYNVNNDILYIPNSVTKLHVNKARNL